MSIFFLSLLSLSLISVFKLCHSGYYVYFSDSHCFVQDRNSQRLIGTGRRDGGLYVLEEFHLPARAASITVPVDLSSFRLGPKYSSFYLWHARLGHVSGSRLKYLVSTDALGDVHCHDISECSSCKLG